MAEPSARLRLKRTSKVRWGLASHASGFAAAAAAAAAVTLSKIFFGATTKCDGRRRAIVAHRRRPRCRRACRSSLSIACSASQAQVLLLVARHSERRGARARECCARTRGCARARMLRAPRHALTRRCARARGRRAPPRAGTRRCARESERASCAAARADEEVRARENAERAATRAEEEVHARERAARAAACEDGEARAREGCARRRARGRGGVRVREGWVRRRARAIVEEVCARKRSAESVEFNITVAVCSCVSIVTHCCGRRRQTCPELVNLVTDWLGLVHVSDSSGRQKCAGVTQSSVNTHHSGSGLKIIRQCRVA